MLAFIRDRVAVRCAALAAFGVLAFSCAESARADVPAGTFGFDGSIDDIAATVGGTYLAGSFEQQQALTGSAVAVGADGTLDESALPRVVGRVTQAVADESGGWYLGGEFKTVGSVSRSNLVHVGPDGAVDLDFAPAPDGGVSALTLAGDTLYVGGYFETIGGQSRYHLAAVDADTGTATAWNPGPDGGGCCGVVIAAIAVTGSSVFVGGNFSEVGGEQRVALAEIDASGDATSFDADLGSSGGPETPVEALAMSGGTLYLAGAFDSVQGQPRGGLAAIDLATGAVTAWDPDPEDPDAFWGPWIHDIAVSAQAVYVAGRFVAIGGEPRSNLAVVDATTGTATAFDPAPDQPVEALSLVGPTLYAGGEFETIGGASRRHAAALAADTGAVRPFDPQPNGPVEALAVAGAAVVLGGGFYAAGPPLAEISGLAKLNPDGSLDTDFAPQPDGPIDVVAAAGGVAYAAGEFTSIGGSARAGLAAVSGSDGSATAWNPAPSGDSVFFNALQVVGGTVYVGGRFEAIGGQPRANLAALDAQTGAASGFAPDPDGTVSALAVAGTTVYAAGGFSTIGGQSRGGLAATDAATGAARAFNPNPDDWVMELAVIGDTLYAGGWFSHIGGAARSHLAGLDATTGSATAFDAGLDGSVNDLAVSSSRLYVAGFFTEAGGQPRHGLAAFDAPSGGLASLAPDLGFGADAVAVLGQAVHVGGLFSAFGGQPTGPYVQLTDPDATPADTTAPQITITKPAEGEHFTQGSTIATSFSCDDGSGSGVASCTGASTLDTAVAGTRQFTVSAVDGAGNATSKTVSYVVDGAPTGGATSGSSQDPPAAGGPSQFDQDLAVIDGGLAAVRSAAVAKSGKSVALTVPEDALPAGASISVTLTVPRRALAAARSVRIGRASASVVAGRATVLKVRLTAKARKTLKRRRKLKAKVAIAVEAPSGARRTKTKSLTLKLRRR